MSGRVGKVTLLFFGASAFTYGAIWNYPAPFERGEGKEPHQSRLKYFWQMPWFARFDYLLWDLQCRRHQFLAKNTAEQEQMDYLWDAYDRIKNSDEGAISPMATDALVYTVNEMFKPLLQEREDIKITGIIASENFPAFESALELLLKKPHVGESITEELKRLRLGLAIGERWLSLLQHKLSNFKTNEIETAEQSDRQQGAGASLGFTMGSMASDNMEVSKWLDKERKWRSKYVLIDQKLPLYLPYDFRESFHAMVARHTKQ